MLRFGWYLQGLESAIVTAGRFPNVGEILFVRRSLGGFCVTRAMLLLGLIKRPLCDRALLASKRLESQIRETSLSLFSPMGDKGILQISALTITALEGKISPPETA